MAAAFLPENYDPSRATDEISRIVLSLPEDASIHGVQYLAIVLERTGHDGAIRQVVLGETERAGNLPYWSEWNLLGSEICSQRATRTVSGEITVGGAPITPERYMGLWRKAVADAVPAAEALERHGFLPVIVIDAPLASNRGAQSARTMSPFDTFEDFEAAYRARMKIAPDESWFRLELPLSEPTAARNACYAWSYVAHPRTPLEGRIRIELRAPTPPSDPAPTAAVEQDDLFHDGHRAS